MPKVTSVPVGKTLYHGTVRKLPNGFPGSKTGSWFATDPVQSILHALKNAGAKKDVEPYLYIYKVIQSPKVLLFKDAANFNKWAGANENSMAFTAENLRLASNLCGGGKHAGWWFPDDQTQVMLCNPMGFLKFVKVLKINRPEKGWYNTNFLVNAGKGMHRKMNINKFSTTQVRLNNVINTTQPSPYIVYEFQNPRPGGEVRVFNHKGDVVVRRGGVFQNFTHNGKVFSGYRLPTQGAYVNQAKIVAARVRAKHGVNVSNWHPWYYELASSRQPA